MTIQTMNKTEIRTLFVRSSGNWVLREQMGKEWCEKQPCIFYLVYFCLPWDFMAAHGLSLAAASRGCSHQIFASLALSCLHGLKSRWLFRNHGANTSPQFTSLFSFLQSMHWHLKLCPLLFYYFIVYFPQQKSTRRNRICLAHCWMLKSAEECLSLSGHSVKEKVREGWRKGMETGVNLLSP